VTTCRPDARSTTSPRTSILLTSTGTASSAIGTMSKAMVTVVAPATLTDRSTGAYPRAEMRSTWGPESTRSKRKVPSSSVMGAPAPTSSTVACGTGAPPPLGTTRPSRVATCAAEGDARASARARHKTVDLDQTPIPCIRSDP
jgi:hypothetical protein